MSTDNRIKRTVHELFGPFVNSTNRLEKMLKLVRGVPPEVFWGVLAQTWSSCDDSWRLQPELLGLMRRHSAQRPPTSARAWPINVYRGCAFERIDGVSWTTAIEVAARFARGHRGIPLDEPVIANGMIDQQGVFLEIGDRNEAELLIDPTCLTELEWVDADP